MYSIHTGCTRSTVWSCAALARRVAEWRTGPEKRYSVDRARRRHCAQLPGQRKQAPLQANTQHTVTRIQDAQSHEHMTHSQPKHTRTTVRKFGKVPNTLRTVRRTQRTHTLKHREGGVRSRKGNRAPQNPQQPTACIWHLFFASKTFTYSS